MSTTEIFLLAMLTVPVVHPKPNRAQHRGLVHQASS